MKRTVRQEEPFVCRESGNGQNVRKKKEKYHLSFIFM